MIFGIIALYYFSCFICPVHVRFKNISDRWLYLFKVGLLQLSFPYFDIYFNFLLIYEIKYTFNVKNLSRNNQMETT
jgi:hypothetical protein